MNALALSRPVSQPVSVTTARPGIGLRRFVAVLPILLAALAAGPAAHPQPAAAADGCGTGSSQIALSRVRSAAGFAAFRMTLSNATVYQEGLGGSATFKTCSHGSIYLNWGASLRDYGRLVPLSPATKLSFLGASFKFRTNTGRVVTSTKQWTNGEPYDSPYGTERSHYDVLAGEYPTKARFIFYARSGSGAIGTFSRTCTVTSSTGSPVCENKTGAGDADWSIN